MSSSAASVSAGAADNPARRAALRLAFGVTACFAIVEALRWDVTFIAPMLAAQMLIKLPRPPAIPQGIGLIGLFVLSTGGVLAVSLALLSHPAVLVLALGLILYLSFYAHARGAPEIATLLVQISAVSLPLIAVLSPALAFTFAKTLVLGGAVALLTVYAAHAAFPEPAAEQAETPQTLPAVDANAASARALMRVLVLMPVMIWFLLDATGTVDMAIVMLIVIITLLRQPDMQQGQRAALGVILGNAIGGVAAVIAYGLVSMNGTLLFFSLTCLAASLLFAGLIVSSGERAPLFAIAFATFILLLGLGLTPLPGGSGEAFTSRLVNVLLASAYAVGALSIAGKWAAPNQPQAG